MSLPVSHLTIGPGITIGGGINIDPLPVTPELMLSLDAAGYTSGPWIYTVSGRSFTLYSGVTYSGSNGGALSFDPASGQYAQCASSLPDLSTWSVEVWHYYTGTNTGQSPCIITELYPGSTGQINYFIGALDSSTTNLEAGYFNGGFQITPGGYNLTASNWYQIVGICSPKRPEQPMLIYELLALHR
jgi:hypothetical protein